VNTSLVHEPPRYRSPVQRALERIVRARNGRPAVIATAPAVSIATIVRRFWPFLRPHRRWIVVGFVPLAILPVIETLEIWLFQVVVDDVLAPGDLALLPTLAAAFLGLTLTTAVLSYVDRVVTTLVSERFTLGIRRAIFAHLLRQTPDSLDRRHLGDLLARISGDTAAVEDLMVSAPGELVSAVLRAALFSGAMFLIDPYLALIALLLAPLFWAAARLFASTARGLAREQRRRRGGAMALAQESLSHAPLVQAAGREADELARFEAEGEAAADAAVASARLSSILLPFVDLIEISGALLITGLGTIALAEGRLSLGGLLVFLAYLAQLYRPVRDLAELTSLAFTASGGAERILEMLDREPDVADRQGARDPGRVMGQLGLEGVTFAYSGGRRVLTDVSVVFEPGTVTAIVGPSGAGKSTLVKLLLRFADPSEGRVLLDGQDLRGLTLESVRRNVAVQFQESQLLDAGLFENVRYARPSATDGQVRAALQAASALAVHDGSDGVGDMRLTQHGRRLSGGQRRRVEIARLLIQDAPVVVLDEPTSGLDADTARSVMQAVREALVGRTVIVFTHDPEALEIADRVLVLDSAHLVDAASDSAVREGTTIDSRPPGSPAFAAPESRA
jgi:ABC-type multidrug transport system fused ATPase/permease subunit